MPLASNAALTRRRYSRLTPHCSSGWQRKRQRMTTAESARLLTPAISRSASIFSLQAGSERICDATSPITAITSSTFSR